jgi:hypothetical protein
VKISFSRRTVFNVLSRCPPGRPAEWQWITTWRTAGNISRHLGQTGSGYKNPIQRASIQDVLSTEEKAARAELTSHLHLVMSRMRGVLPRRLLFILMALELSYAGNSTYLPGPPGSHLHKAPVQTNNALLFPLRRYLQPPNWVHSSESSQRYSDVTARRPEQLQKKRHNFRALLYTRCYFTKDQTLN